MTPELRAQAACRTHGPEGWWKLDHTEQKYVCRGCPVARQCLEEALATPVEDRWNVWGGVNFVGVRTSVYHCLCANCGLDFYATKGRAVTCSDTCRQAFGRKSLSEQQRVRSRMPAPRCIHTDRYPIRVCSECGDEFVSKTVRHLTCGARCLEVRRKRLNTEWQRLNRSPRSGVLL